ncbi:MAG: phage holin family protein [Betaproteobacteria bacterium]|nr:phage holin family protein [Betaproteobacteria bacterium]
MSDSGAGRRAAPDEGLMASLRRLLATLLESLRTRLQILAVECEEERERLREIVLYGVASLFFLALGFVLLSLLLIALFWDSHRLTVIAVLAAVYLVAGGAAAAVVRAKARNRPAMFSATLAELADDYRRLREGL